MLAPAPFLFGGQIDLLEDTSFLFCARQATLCFISVEKLDACVATLVDLGAVVVASEELSARPVVVVALPASKLDAALAAVPQADFPLGARPVEIVALLSSAETVSALAAQRTSVEALDALPRVVLELAARRDPVTVQLQAERTVESLDSAVSDGEPCS